MGNFINFNYDGIKEFVKEKKIFEYQKKVNEMHKILINKTGKGRDFLGWLDLPSKTPKSFIDRIISTAERVRESADVFLVIGIGGSYLGARSVIEFMQKNSGRKNFIKRPEIIYLGNNLCSAYIKNVLDYIEDKEIIVNVISKSGTTTETAVAFRIIREVLNKKYSRKKNKDRIITTTDAKKGGLRKLSEAHGYESFVIPDNVGGRFSVLTAVGLLPIAVAGCDIRKLLNGAKEMEKLTSEPDLKSNISYQYAVIRNIMSKNGKVIEILSTFHSFLYYFCEWWKQLFGESEGKEGKGIFPATANFTTDLHSIGQLIQDGQRNIFETFIICRQLDTDIKIPPVSDSITLNLKGALEHKSKSAQVHKGTKVQKLKVKSNNLTSLQSKISDLQFDLDGLDYLVGKSINYINEKAYEGTVLAHKEGKVPNMTIFLPKRNEFYLGQLIYFFERAVAMSGYLLGINPFDQPGVEAYKNNMFRLLGKPK